VGRVKVLVTGSSGFVGSNLCRALIAQGHQVRAFHRPTSMLRLLDGLPVEHVIGDLTQPEGLPSAMEGVDAVFHAAAWMGGHDQPGRQYAVTVEGTRSVLQAARKAGVARVVHTSSVAALGIPRNGPDPSSALMNENHAWNYRPDYYPYGYAKYLAEQEVQKFVASGLDVVIVNPTLVFGPGDLYRQSASIITQVAERRVSAAIEGGINCVHIDDVVAGHLAAFECGKTGERYILGGENLTHLQMLQMIASVVKAPPPNLVLPTWLVRSMAVPAQWFQTFLNLPIDAALLRLSGFYFFYDLSKASNELGLVSHHPVQQAFEDAFAWFKTK